MTAIAERRKRRTVFGAVAAVLLISEDLDEIMELADRVLVMSEGAIAYDRPVAEAEIRVAEPGDGGMMMIMGGGSPPSDEGPDAASGAPPARNRGGNPRSRGFRFASPPATFWPPLRGSGLRAPGSGFRVPGSGFRVPGSGVREELSAGRPRLPFAIPESRRDAKMVAGGAIRQDETPG